MHFTTRNLPYVVNKSSLQVKINNKGWDKGTAQV